MRAPRVACARAWTKRDVRAPRARVARKRASLLTLAVHGKSPDMVHAPTDTAPDGGPRVHALDGLRAVSIALVVVGHASATAGFPIPGLAHGPLGDVANLGVRVFFVLSGYLITTLLVDELRRNGRVDLRAFYVRRALRIAPAFYVYLGAIVLAALAGLVPLRARDVLLALTYTVNFSADRAWHVGHAWSLSVEEQFYLLWPAALSALGLAAGMRVAAALLFVAPACRLAAFAVPSLRPLVGEAFPTICDALAVGCLVASARDVLDRSPRYRALLASRAFVIVPIVAVVVNAEAARARVFFAVGASVVNLAVALVVDRLVRLPDAPTSRALASGPAVFVGARSYSLYLWQQPFLEHGARFVGTRFPLNVALACGAALASFELVERPFLRLRHHLAAAVPRPAPRPPVATAPAAEPAPESA